MRFKEISHLYQERASLQDRLVQSKESSLKQQKEIQTLKENIFMMEKAQQAQQFTSFSQNSSSKFIQPLGASKEYEDQSIERSHENQSPPSFLETSKQIFGIRNSQEWPTSQDDIADKIQELAGATTPRGSAAVDKMLLEQIKMLKVGEDDSQNQLDKKNEEIRLREQEVASN